MKLLKGFNRLFRNLIYLCRIDLWADTETDTVYRIICHVEELVKTKMVFGEDSAFRILDDDRTWEKILERQGSFVRVGDGELALISGKSIDFQRYDERLAKYLIKILSGDRTDLFIGIDYNYFHGFENITQTIRRHNYLWGPEYKKVLVQYCNPDREYISSSFNQLYIDYEMYDWKKYLCDIERLFAEKDIVVFAGEGILAELRYNLFALARSYELVQAPAKNAFAEFDSLLEKARSFAKEKILCFVLGPTSKPLVYELSREGYTAWDIGHMAKDYDYCRRNMVKNSETVAQYFAPD